MNDMADPRSRPARTINARPPGTVDKPAPTEENGERPYSDFDRSLTAAAARATGGLSPHPFIEAWTD